MTIKRKLLLSGGLVALLATMSIFIPHKSYAFSTSVTITNRAPTVQSANIVGSGNTVEPWFAVGEGEYYGPNTYAKAYVPAGQTANITVIRGAGYCVGLGTDVGKPKVTFRAFILKPDESLGSQVDIAQNLTNGTGCGNLKLTLQGANPSIIDGHQNYDEYYIEARLTGPFPGCHDPACDTEKSFQLSTSNGLVGVSKNVIDYGALPGESQFGIYMRDAPSKGGNNWDWAIQYAPRCKQDNPPQAETVGIYDIDKGVAGYNQPNLSALVDKDNRTDTNFTWGIAPAGGPYRVSRPPWTNPGQSGTFDNLSYTSSYQNRYLLVFRDIDWHNTVQVQLPYDEFDAQQSVGNKCAQTPSFSCTATVVDATHVSVTITNNASFAEGRGFQLRQSPDTMWKAGQPQTNPNVEWPVAPGFTANFLPGASTSFTYTRPANAVENYILYNGPAGSGASIVGSNPLCSVSTGSVSISCTPQPPSPAEVGQTGTFKFNFIIRNTTANVVTVTYSSDQGVPAGSLSSVSAPSPPNSPVAAGQTITPQVSITALMNSDSTLTVTATYPGDPNPTTCSDPVTVVAMPYFQAWNSGVSAGGGFKSSGGSCNQTGDPPYITPVASNDPGYKDQYSGDIRAFGRQTPATGTPRGARTDFGAVALGLNPGSAAGTIGFFSGDVSSGKRAVFANTNNTYGTFGVNHMGGYLNSSSPAHCVIDFYSTTRDPQVPPTPASGTLQSIIDGCTDRCQFNYTGNDLSTANIPKGKQITIYSDHNITLDGNITMGQPFDATDQSSVPYFALIVKGNIYVSSGANQLDGLYIAQPSSSAGSDGVFATCTTGASDHCNSQLVVNGAVIAQHVELLRAHGTLDAPSGANSGIGSSPAEIFNFTPSLIIGNPAFASQFGKSEILFSLPPVF